MNTDFYRAFEEKFRGPRELIKSRLQIYLPFILPLREYWPDAQAVDLGCGRGEWLELLNEQGFYAQGVDLDDGMLAACRELGLSVQTGDALEFLKALPDASQSIISGFHIAEHLPFDALQELASQALRVLKPAGLLILETPNPENLVVATSNFYLDPTHKRPLPSLLLSFLAEFAGFKRNTIVRLQESKNLIDNPELSLLAVLNGASPDYAVVAQKDGPEELFAALTSAFDTAYGLTLDKLADTYQQQAEVKVQQVEAKVQQAEEKAQQAEAKAQQAEAKAQQAEVKAQQAEAMAQQADEALNDLVRDYEQIIDVVLGIQHRSLADHTFNKIQKIKEVETNMLLLVNKRQAELSRTSSKIQLGKYNRILDNQARTYYQPVISRLFSLVPDMMARKIPEANVQQAFVLDTVERLAETINSPKILCVGSYDDTAASGLKALGYTMDEIDPALNYDLNTFFHLPTTCKSHYDIVFSTSVIEHVDDDEMFVRQISELLAPGGVAIITCDYNDQYKLGSLKPQEDFRLYTKKDLMERLLLRMEDCSLVDNPAWECPNPDFTYAGCRYTFATFVVRKNACLL